MPDLTRAERDQLRAGAEAAKTRWECDEYSYWLVTQDDDSLDEEGRHIHNMSPACTLRILDQLDRMEAGLKRKAQLEKSNATMRAELGRLAPLLDRMETALERIDAWSQAYPLSVFPEPDLEHAAKVLKAAGLTLDSISASALRHGVEGVGKIARVALQGGPGREG